MCNISYSSAAHRTYLVFAETRDLHGRLAGRAGMVEQLLPCLGRCVPRSGALDTLLDQRQHRRVTACLAGVAAAVQSLAAHVVAGRAAGGVTAVRRARRVVTVGRRPAQLLKVLLL